MNKVGARRKFDNKKIYFLSGNYKGNANDVLVFEEGEKSKITKK